LRPTRGQGTLFPGRKTEEKNEYSKVLHAEKRPTRERSRGPALEKNGGRKEERSKGAPQARDAFPEGGETDMNNKDKKFPWVLDKGEKP